jgi:hypothetical protein
MRAFAGSRHAMKLLFAIASSGIENSKPKVLWAVCGHYSFARLRLQRFNHF